MATLFNANGLQRFYKFGVLVTFFAVLTDGFDTAILSMLVPHLAEDWGISPAAFSYPLALTNFGVVIGYLVSGPVAEKFSEKKVLIWGLIVFGGATAITAMTLPLESIAWLTVSRGLTGLGLGVVMPNAVVVGTQQVPEKNRQPVSVFVTMGIISGATVAGFAGGHLISGLGTSGVLWLAAVAPLLAAVLLQVFVPTVSRFTEETSSQGDHGKVLSVEVFARLLRGRRRYITLTLWAASFLIFTITYTFKSWIPTLFSEYGMSTHAAGMGLAYYSLGGVIAGLLLIPTSAKFGTGRAMFVMTAIAAICTAILGSASMGEILIMLTVFVIGAGITTGTIGMTAMCVALYDRSTRTTGIAVTLAFGRAGSIFGPAIGGALMAFHWSAQSIVMLLALPLAITAIGWALLNRLAKSRASSEPVVEETPLAKKTQ